MCLFASEIAHLIAEKMGFQKKAPSPLLTDIGCEVRLQSLLVGFSKTQQFVLTT
jgi:hypothetical protein